MANWKNIGQLFKDLKIKVDDKGGITSTSLVIYKDTYGFSSLEHFGPGEPETLKKYIRLRDVWYGDDPSSTLNFEDWFQDRHYTEGRAYAFLQCVTDVITRELEWVKDGKIMSPATDNFDKLSLIDSSYLDSEQKVAISQIYAFVRCYLNCPGVYMMAHDLSREPLIGKSAPFAAIVFAANALLALYDRDLKAPEMIGKGYKKAYLFLRDIETERNEEENKKKGVVMLDEEGWDSDEEEEKKPKLKRRPFKETIIIDSDDEDAQK